MQLSKHSSEAKLFPSLDPKIRESWMELWNQNKFDVEVAKAVMTPISDQKAKGHTLPMVWTNRDSLPSIRSEIKYMGTASAIIKLMDCLMELKRLSVTNNALDSAYGLEYVATTIVNDETLRSWKIVEFNNIIHMAMKGEFGVIYRIDLSVIYEWINKYDVIRCAHIAEEKRKEQKKHEEEVINMRTDGMNREVAARMAAIMKNALEPSMEKEAIKNAERKRKIEMDRETMRLMYE